MDRYVNFDLVIEREESNYVARVIDSPAGEATSQFSFPFSKLEVENFLLRVGQSRRSVRRIDSPQMEAARQFGEKLYDTVFSGEVKTCFRRALDEADRQEQGLRIRVRFEDALDMADLPWEYLYSSGLGRFLVLSSQTPLVRYIDLPTRIRPLQVSPPLRILVMVSSPTDVVSLDVEDEYQRLEDSLADLVAGGRVVLDRLDEATLSKLQQRLRQQTYHIFHFVGHGGFDEQRDDGVLMLEDEHGRGRAVSGHELGTLLHDHRSLRLAVLNSCEGARNSASDPFAGAAQSLVQQGIPAVIAMQFEISDDAAILFAHEFYAAVADGYPVDAATAEARKALFTANPDVEWGTPVLNMRSPDGMVFDVQGEAVPVEAGESAVRSASIVEKPEDAPSPPPGENVEPAVEPPQQEPIPEPVTETAPTATVMPPPIIERSEINEPVRASPTSAVRPVASVVTAPGKKGLPAWLWVIAALLGTVLVIGIIGSMLPDNPPTTTEDPFGGPAETANPAPDTTDVDTTEPLVIRPGPEVHAEQLFSFDGDRWPTWDTEPIDIQATPHVVFSDQWDGVIDHDTSWRFGWDESFLYAQATVVDDLYFQGNSGNTAYLGDSLNLDFDTDLAGDSETTRPDGDDFQLLISVGSDIAQGGVTLFQGDGSIFRDAPFQISTTMKVLDFSSSEEVAYVVDVAVAWSDLSLDVDRGSRIGFRVSANDNDLLFPIQEVMYTNAAGSNLFDTTTWGTLVLD